MEIHFQWRLFGGYGVHGAVRGPRTQLNLSHNLEELGSPEMQIHTWLIIQNRVRTADQLQRRGWPNCGICPLCKQVQESAAHLLFQCRFTARVWTEVVTWLGIQDHSPLTWRHEDTVQDWWLKTINTRGHIKKAIGSVLMLVMWEIWKEQNARVFHNTASPTTIITARIKEEGHLWALAGAKHMSAIMSRE